FTLAGADDPAPVKECPSVTPSVRLVLDQLAPYPAAAVNSRYDILAHNVPYTAIVGDLGELPPEERNLMWLAFTPSRFRDVLIDYRTERLGMVARFRAAMADHSAEPAWKALLARLRKASPDFEEEWQRHEVMRPRNGIKRFQVPGVGLLRCEYTNFWLGPRLGTRLISYTPLDEETRLLMDRLPTRR
ncbi:XRE family transcriptional regulator, partial [Streptomyces sp. NPDC057757]